MVKYIEPGLEFKKRSRSNGRSKCQFGTRICVKLSKQMRETKYTVAGKTLESLPGQMNRDEGSYLLQEYLHVRECRKKHGVLTRKHKPQTN